MAVDNTDVQRQLMSASRQSFLFWCNAFAWTYLQKMVDATGNEVPVTGSAVHVPFITWQVQDEAASAMISCIASGDGLNFDKSRGMGASWLMLAVSDWYFLFQEGVNIGAVSRKEALVDHSGDMDSLFEKIRYFNRMCPPWMIPPIRDTYMFMHNLELDSTIAGESTNSDVGRGGRKTFYIVDEAAAIRNADEVESSLSQNTPCQIWASTAHGPSTQFHKRITEGRGTLIQLPWYRHPKKARGAYQFVDETGKIKWTSPWKKIQDEKYSRKTVAQEIEMDHGQAGDMFFDYTELNRHRQDHEMAPNARGGLVWVEPMTANEQEQQLQAMNYEAMQFIPNHKRAPWRLWLNLTRNGRPNQYWSYVFGIDISNGAGGSNSVISVMAVEIHQIIAKFWDAYTPPEELAMVAARAGIWFGGLRPPAFMCWENNGPGGIFGRKLVKMGYPSFYRQRIDNSLKNTRTPRWGWHSNNERKEVMLGMYRDALSRDDIINPCAEALEEASDYIYDDSGLLIPAVLREEARGGRALHGDHVIADGLCWLGAQEMGRQKKQPSRAPRGSYAWRRARQKLAEKNKDPWRP